MFLELLVWWYGTGWLDIARRIGRRVVGIMQLFSVSILISTLFSPWKRIVSPPGRSFDQKIRGAVDNLVSRAVGFFVRSLVLLSATIFTTIAAIIGFVMVMLWPILPVAIVYCFYKAVAS